MTENNKEPVWKILDQNLIFSFAGKEFFKAPLKLNVSGMCYSTKMEPVAHVVEPTSCLKNGTDGCLINSYAVTQNPPKVKTLKHTILYTKRHYNRYCVNLNGTFDSYIQKFKSTTRKRIRNRINKFTRFCNGELSFKCYKTIEEFEEFYPLALSVSVKTYQHKLHHSGLPDSKEDIKEYSQLAETNAVRGFLLFHDNKPISYNFLTLNNHVALAEYGGYDADYAKWSVGTIIEWLSLQQLFLEDDLIKLDYGFGEEDYKNFFGTNSQLVADVYFLNKNIKNRLLILSHATCSQLVKMVGNMSDKMGLKKRITKFMRQTA